MPESRGQNTYALALQVYFWERMRFLFDSMMQKNNIGPAMQAPV